MAHQSGLLHKRIPSPEGQPGMCPRRYQIMDNNIKFHSMVISQSNWKYFPVCIFLVSRFENPKCVCHSFGSAAQDREETRSALYTDNNNWNHQMNVSTTDMKIYFISFLFIPIDRPRGKSPPLNSLNPGPEFRIPNQTRRLFYSRTHISPSVPPPSWDFLRQ